MLKRVSIQNFKSLKDVTLDLQKVNLLIGPNNSGKTNFLKALEFFNKVVLQNPSLSEHQTLSYSFLRSSSYISLELTYSRDNESILFGRRISFQNNDDKQSYQTIIKDGIEISRDNNGYPGISYLRRQFGNFLIYKPDPNKLTVPGPVGKETETVNYDASDLVNFLDLMLGKYRRTTFSQIEKDLQKCIPEFTEINLDNSNVTEDLIKFHGKDKAFKRIGLTNEKQNVTYWADELSEGTLYFLALLCIINQPNPPKLLLLEEPEKGIHPRRIEEIINFIFGLAEEKDIQVIMTTHSPIVVDMFKDMPESVFVFDKDDEGATHVKNLQKDIIEPETAESERLGIDPPQYLNGLGQAWKVGLIGGVPR
ncbi:AAA family ATPase [Fibrella sp. HMF5335]|uniref:AAA family ATPase n=1 Tax=Fibrella rubiginis TaxID=2817060 RepID=A0A939GLA8_9BACT|nr:ATP-binding protein [Fibrella rubiginis]MBO0939515.1 AAA family ATPase [Fibrella rubiginis]